MSRVNEHLRYWCKNGEASEAARRVLALLDEWQGLHHFEDSLMRKVDWTCDFMIVVKVDRHHTAGQLSTFDFDNLTSLVFLAHDHCIRVQIAPVNFRFMELVFHPRPGREGDISRHHPSIEQAVAKWRERRPADRISAFHLKAEKEPAHG